MFHLSLFVENNRLVKSQFSFQSLKDETEFRSSMHPSCQFDVQSAATVNHDSFGNERKKDKKQSTFSCFIGSEFQLPSAKENQVCMLNIEK